MTSLIWKSAIIIFIFQALLLVISSQMQQPLTIMELLLVESALMIGLALPAIYYLAVKPLRDDMHRLINDLERQRQDFESQINDMTQAARLAAQHDMEFSSELISDPLTGLNNRRYFETELPEIVKYVLEAGDGVALMFFDLDHFKQINDTLGHEVGDEALKAVGDALRRHVRERDIVCRIGGDEFLVALFHISDTELAVEKAENIISAIQKIGTKYNTGKDTMGASAGIVHTMNATLDFDDIIKHADDAMYEAKRSGRGRVVLWQDKT